MDPKSKKNSKNVVITILIIVVIGVVVYLILNSTPANIVYQESGADFKYTSEQFDISFLSSLSRVDGIDAINQNRSDGDLTGVISPLLSIAFELTSTVLEMKEQEFIAQYFISKSNLNPVRNELPDLEINRKVTIEGSTQNALQVKIKSKVLDSTIVGGFVYYVDEIDLNYSNAKVKDNNYVLDYIMELELTFIDKGASKHVIKSKPIVVPSVQFHSLDKMHEGTEFVYRSNVLQFPVDGALSDVSITITESNPVRIRAQKILSLWRANQEYFKEIIDVIIKAITT